MQSKVDAVRQGDYRFKRDEILGEIRKLDTWRHRIDLGQSIITPGREDCAQELARLNLPDDLTGKRVLDIGCSDGFFSFECERRGGEVVGMDDFTSTPFNDGDHGFVIAKRILGANAVFLKQSIYELDPRSHGPFQLVLFLNVLYHLRHPMLALEKIRQVLEPRGVMLIKTYFEQDIRILRWGMDLSRRAAMRFFEGDELNDDPSNWWAPNRRCLEAMIKSAGFTSLARLGTYGDRIYYRANVGG